MTFCSSFRRKIPAVREEWLQPSNNVVGAKGVRDDLRKQLEVAKQSKLDA